MELVVLLAFFVILPVYLLSNARDKRQAKTVHLKEISKKSWDQMFALSKAFDNVQERKQGKIIGTDEHGGQIYDQVVTQEELFEEYARVVGAIGCPCSACLEIQKK